MKRIVVFVWIWVLIMPVMAQQSVKEDSVVLQTLTGNIYGTLRIPETQQAVPVVLLIAGSGPTDRNGNQPMMQNNSLKMLSESLSAKGVAALSFDKRGIGESRESGKKEEDLKFDDYVNDVRLWIDWLAKDKRFSGIIVAGHSEGSLIGMIACENNPKVSRFISIAGSGVPADQIIKEQMEKQPQQVKDLVFPIINELKAGKLVANVNPLLNSLLRPSIQPYLIFWFRYDPQTEIKKLTIPVFIVQGTTDIQVPEKHADLLAAANPKAEKKIIENMNHVLKSCNTYDQQTQVAVYTDPDLPLKPELVTSILSFIVP